MQRTHSRRIRSILILPAIFAALLLAAGCQSTVEERHANGALKKVGRTNMAGQQIGEWTHYYENGKVRSRGSYDKDVQTGLWTYFYKSGEKEMEGLFEAKKRKGLWRYYHRVGNQPSAQGEFRDGLMSGEWTFWNAQGERDQLGYYLGDKQTMRWEYWHGGGRKKAEGYYLAGAQVGAWRFWDAKGVASEKNFATPTGYELVREAWTPEQVRREGFLLEGKPVGLWVTWHENGRRRMAGEFADGLPNGEWRAWNAAGELIAAGPVANGKATGSWELPGSGDGGSVGIEGVRPPVLFTGEWSPSSVAGERPPEEVIDIWLAEVASSIDEGARATTTAAAPTSPAPEQIAQVSAAPIVPIRAQPWTVTEEKNLTNYARAYGLTPPSGGSDPFSRYAGSRGKRAGTGGDEERAKKFIGKTPTQTRFLTPGEQVVDVSSYRGKKNVLLLILRGFAGEVCVYCVTQVGALSEEEVKKQLAELDTEVVVIYPGPFGGVDAFQEAYGTVFGENRRCDYCIAYDPDLRFVDTLELKGDLAIPTALLLDKQGVIRWAYVGKEIYDRPPAAKILENARSLQRP